MTILLAALCGFGLDLLLGDPAALTPVHPVVLMGRCISGLEGRLRRVFPKTERGELAAGAVLAALLPLGSFGVSFGILRVLGRLWAPGAFALQVIWSWQALAVKNLRDEAMGVYRALTGGTLEEARRAVSRIVGRDTDALTAEGVTKAAVETVAENFADGVAAPMVFLLIGGAPLALACKAVNTMDSMVGYRNERYLYFGRAAARLDDVVNYLPARLAALLLIGASALTGRGAKQAWRIWRRDRRNHASPNSAQCESVMAVALGIELGGPACYFGRRYEKPTIGDPLRPAEPEDIRRACALLYVGSVLCAVLLCGLRAALVWKGILS